MGSNEQDLVKSLVNIMGECSDIIDAVGGFIESHLTPDEERRLEKDGAEADDSSLVDKVESKLDNCMSIIEAVDDFNKKYSDQMEQEEDVGNENNATLNDPITLNVGGELFTTSLATLRAKTGTYLEKMFRKGSSTTCSAD